MPPRFWHADKGQAARLLAPLAAVYAGAVSARRWLYRHGWRKAVAPPVPVIVVGNLTVGGTGKTPLVGWLVAQLQERGWSPAVVARGYGGRVGVGPLTVSGASDPAETGDEPVLLARRTGRPVYVGSDRPAAVAAAHQEAGCDIVVSDDGLQHYRMARSAELAVINGARHLGNRRLLPAGPLREPPSRLNEVDLIIFRGEAGPESHCAFALKGKGLIALDGRERPWPGGPAQAVAGIGHPDRFFTALGERGIELRGCYPFPDHHAYRARDLDFEGEEPIIMTEKDAVKCRHLPQASRIWYMPVEAVPSVALEQAVDSLLERIAQGERA